MNHGSSKQFFYQLFIAKVESEIVFLQVLHIKLKINCKDFNFLTQSGLV